MYAEWMVHSYPNLLDKLYKEFLFLFPLENNVAKKIVK